MLYSESSLKSQLSIQGASTETVQLYWHPPNISDNIKEVFIVGDWSRWLKKQQMKKRKYQSGYVYYSIVLALSQGWHQYKFIVDGVWLIDKNSPTVNNSLGSTNNVIQILPKKTYVKKGHKGVLISLNGHLPQVTIQGSWDNWKNSLILQNSFNQLKGRQESFIYLQNLEAERSYEFKFKYKGQYFTEDKYPTTANGFGTCNNYVIVYQHLHHSPVKRRPSNICLDSSPQKQLKGKIFKWTKIHPELQLPYDRVEGHTMCNVGQNIFIFGGQSRHQFYNSFAKINCSLTKLELLEIVPDNRAFHSMHPYGNKIIIFGGHNNKLLEDINIFNVSQGRWQKSTILQCFKQGKRIQHQKPSCVIYESLFVFFGGCEIYKNQQSLSNELRILDLQKMSWVANLGLQGQKPAPRYGHAATLIQSNMYIFGGLKHLKGRENFNDLWRVRLSKFHELHWQKVEPLGEPPQPRHGHSMNTMSNLIVIFGGRLDNDELSNDINIYNSITNQWILPIVHGSVPRARCNHATCQFPTDRLIMFGGKTFDNNKTTTFFILQSNGIPRSQSFGAQESNSQEQIISYDQ